MTSRTSYAENPPQSTGSTIYEDARADAKWCSADALGYFHSTFRDHMNDPNLDEVSRDLASERYRAFDDELTNRIRIIQLDPTTAAKRTRDFQNWKALADDVKQRVTVREVLELAGFPITREGRRECHAPCPVCGGHDRLIVWDKKALCRQCRWNPDAIAVAMSFLPRCETFRDAVAWLDDYSAVKGGAR